MQTLEFSAANVLDLTDPAGYLRGALHCGQFVLYSQKLMPLKRGTELPMAEIFVRMRDEERALLPPGDFLSAFQTLGMVAELDRWVVHETITQGLKQGLVESFCINVGRQSIEDPKFLAFVAREMRAAGFPSQRLTFEVAAADCAASLVAARRFGEGLRHLGARLLVQDCLCDRASLSLFRVLRAHYAKIDGAIVRKLRYNAAARSVVATIVKALTPSVETMAESVEDAETLSAVRELGLDYAQGSGISVPAPFGNLLTA